MENKKFMLGDEPKSYPPSSPSQTTYGLEVKRTTSPLPSAVLNNTSTETMHTSNSSSKRPMRHIAKRRSSGTRFMKRSTSMEDTSKVQMRPLPSQQRLQSISPMPIMTQLSNGPNNSKKPFKDQQSPRFLSSRNDSNTSTSSSRTVPSSFIVSSMECAKPIEQTLHATAKSLSPRPSIDVPSAETPTTGNIGLPCSSATKALRHVSASSSPSNTRQSSKPIITTDKRHRHHHSSQRSKRQQQQQQHGEYCGYQRPSLVSHFIQQQTSNGNLDDDSSYQKRMDDQYRDLQQYHHPMLISLMRCLSNKMNDSSEETHPPRPESAFTPKSTSSSSAASSTFFVPATTNSSSLLLPKTESTGTHHQRNHSHSSGYETTGGRYLQQQQQQQHHHQQQQQVQAIHADQRQTIHKNHMKKILQYNDMYHHHYSIGGGQLSANQQSPFIVSSSDFVSPAKRPFALSMASSSGSTSSPWVTSIWDRVWNGLIKA